MNFPTYVKPAFRKPAFKLLAALFWLVPISESVAADQPPNVVFIISDDQAWTDYGFMGHAEIKTPHLDELAARSLVFERGYVSAPLCRRLSQHVARCVAADMSSQLIGHPDDFEGADSSLVARVGTCPLASISSKNA